MPDHGTVRPGLVEQSIDVSSVPTSAKPQGARKKSAPQGALCRLAQTDYFLPLGAVMLEKAWKASVWARVICSKAVRAVSMAPWIEPMAF